jgi:hypothetical protein
MKKRWIVVAMLVMGVLIVVILSQLKDPSSHEATLSDGSIMRFEKVGLGAIKYDSYSSIKAAIAPYVPLQFQSRLGLRVQGTFNIPPHEIGLVLSNSTEPGQKRPADDNYHWSRIEFVESTGFVFKERASNLSAGSASDTSGRSRGMYCTTWGPFPRRDPVLHLRLFEADTERLLFDLHTPNPGYQATFADWTAEPVPMSQTMKPLTVTLKNGPANIPTNFLRDDDLEIVSTDPRWTAIRPQRNFWLTDATGNKADEFTTLSPFEPAWKLHVRVRREASAEFDAGEVWRTKLIALPAAVTAERLALRQTVAGVELSATALCSAGEVSEENGLLFIKPTKRSGHSSTVSHGSTNGVPSWQIDSGVPFFMLTHSALDEDSELIVNVRDQADRKIWTGASSGTSETNGVKSRCVQFEPLPDTTEVQLEVIVNRGRTFEFLVAPRKPDAAQVAP